MTELEKYYTKFNEEHRLTTRHGQVEFFTSMHFIHKYLASLTSTNPAASPSAQAEISSKSAKSTSATLFSTQASVLETSASITSAKNPQTQASQNSAVLGLEKPPVSCSKSPVSSATSALNSQNSPKILDLGAGTGRYAISLAREGFDVTAVELVKKNLDVMNSKHEHIKIWPGNALDLHFLQDETFDITIMFGPLYHLQTKEEKLKALSEARRVTKKNGIIFAAYIMNEYSVLMYAFLKHKIKDCVKNQTLTKDFHALTTEKDLYSYLRLEDINELQKLSGLKRLEMFAQDGPSDYMRQMLNSLDEEEFSLFLEYHLATCQRPELLGASSHVVDILQKLL